MVAIPFPVSSSPGIKPQESGGRLINCYAEKAGEGARFPVIWRRTAGLRQILDITAHDHLRGGIIVGSTLLVAMDARVYAVTESAGLFTASNLGALAGTTPVTCAKNNAGTPNIVCVTENGAFNLFTGSAPTNFADADLPQPNSVAELNGYFLFTIGDGRIFATGLNAVTVSSSAYTTEQSLGGLLRGVTFGSEFFAFGAEGIGVYHDIGASPFPLERRTDTIKKGIAGTHAVAGWEPGWVNQLLWVGDDGIVYRMDGYTPVPVSNEDVTRDIAAALKDGLGADLEASVYMVGKHAFWSLTNPGEWTWDYNVTTQNWNERKSYSRDDWRASRAIRAFNRWITGDRENGLLYDIDETYYREGNDALIFQMESGIVAAFPARMGSPRADFDITAGVGMAAGEDPIQTTPKVKIEWSDDGGYSWSNPVTRDIGAEGEGDALPYVLRTGLIKSKGRRFRLTISDPVHVSVMGGQMVAQQRAA